MTRHRVASGVSYLISLALVACGNGAGSQTNTADQGQDGSATHGSTPLNDASSVGDDASASSGDASLPSPDAANGDASNPVEDSGHTAPSDSSVAPLDSGVGDAAPPSLDGATAEDASADASSPVTDAASLDGSSASSDGSTTSPDASTDAAVSAADASYPANPTPVAVTYSCASSLSNTPTAVSGTFVGATPTSIATGVSFDMQGFQVVATLPGSLITTATGYGETSVSGTATAIDIGSNGTNTASFNAAGKGIAFGPLALVSGEAITLPLPATPETTGPWTATTAGTIDFSAGDVILSVSFSGSIPITTTLTCTPSGAATVFATTTAL